MPTGAQCRFPARTLSSWKKFPFSSPRRADLLASGCRPRLNAPVAGGPVDTLVFEHLKKQLFSLGAHSYAYCPTLRKRHGTLKHTDEIRGRALVTAGGQQNRRKGNKNTRETSRYSDVDLSRENASHVKVKRAFPLVASFDGRTNTRRTAEFWPVSFKSKRRGSPAFRESWRCKCMGCA